jgi:mRNA interferase MazF
MGMVKRFEVYLTALDPTAGSEMQKTRPCVVISPNEMAGLNTVIIAPMTTTCKQYPTRIPVRFAKKGGYIVLDQIRTVDKSRLMQHLGEIDKKTGIEMLKTLREIFENDD